MSLAEFFEVLTLPFMLRAFAVIALLAVAAGIVSVLVNFRGMEFITDGLVHAMFPGLVIGYIIGGSILLLPAALVAALIAIVLITFATRQGKFSNDSAIAVLLASAFSLGVILVSKQAGYVAALESLLFGNLLTVTEWQLGVTAVLAFAGLLVVAGSWRKQLFYAHDPQGFTAAGFSVTAVELLLGVGIALVTVAGVAALGNLLVIALLIVPAASARKLGLGLKATVFFAVAVILVAGFAGIIFAAVAAFAWGINFSAGAVTVLFLVLCYAAAALFSLLKKRLSARIKIRYRLSG